ncbi:MAG TPA: hypothetical protein VNY52_13545 [Solirubrobacteraceae bacterium]|nr:hypothetical protein [Solirubrobacteraceae bacterium]
MIDTERVFAQGTRFDKSQFAGVYEKRAIPAGPVAVAKLSGSD